MDQLDDILHQDLDPTETQEWVESLSAVIDREGTGRAHFLLEKLVDSARRSGGYLPFDPTTEYVNTIPPHLEAKMPCGVFGATQIKKRPERPLFWLPYARSGLPVRVSSAHLALQHESAHRPRRWLSYSPRALRWRTE